MQNKPNTSPSSLGGKVVALRVSYVLLLSVQCSVFVLLPARSNLVVWVTVMS